MKLLLLLTSVLSITWNYQNQNWGSMCNSPDSSPRIIDPTTATEISSSNKMKIVFLGYTGSQTIQNTGNYIQIATNIGYIEVGDVNGRRNFNIKYIQFHTPSEHMIGGTYFPVEMEIICTIQDQYWERDQPNMAIVSVIIQKGIESYFFDVAEISQWPSSAGGVHSTSNVSNLNLAEMFSSTDDYWYYVGTATNPDLRCQEDVLWYIIQDVKQAAAWQVQFLQRLFPSGNSRSINNTPLPALYSSYSRLLFLATLMLIASN